MPNIQYDIYRLNPESPYHEISLFMDRYDLTYRTLMNDSNQSGHTDWIKHAQAGRDFYDLLMNDQKKLLNTLCMQTTAVYRIMAEAPNIAEFFGLKHPVTTVHTYDDCPPRAYHVYPHTYLFDASSDQLIFPEFKTMDKYCATLPKGEPLVVNNLPQFAYICCPQHYDGAVGFVPEDAIKLTPQKLDVYREREQLSFGGGWLDGPGRSFMPPIAGAELPEDFDSDLHQHQPHVIHGSAHMTTVKERWEACDKEDAQRCIPLPPFPIKWAKAHGMAL